MFQVGTSCYLKEYFICIDYKVLNAYNSLLNTRLFFYNNQLSEMPGGGMHMNLSECIKDFSHNLKNKNVDKALEALDNVAEILKVSDKPDICANHILEFYMFEYFFKTREYDSHHHPVHQMYLSVAKILMEQKKYQQALAVLDKARAWNPLDMDILWAVTDCQRQSGKLEDMYASTLELYQYIYTRADMARFYRNLGYYYIEKYDPETAMIIYSYSNMYSHSKNADSEIHYLETALNKECPEYTIEEIQDKLKEKNIPEQISDVTLAILYRAGQFEYESGDKKAAIVCLELLYQVTGAAEVG